MDGTVTSTSAGRVHFPTADFRYGPDDYLLALADALEESGVALEFQELGERDASNGRPGTPWREHSPRELWAAAGRRRRYLQGVNRRVGSLLPAAFKPLALRFVLTEPAAMECLISAVLQFERAGPPITDRGTVDRLLRVVADRLASRPTTPADQAHLERTLRRLDARGKVLLRAQVVRPHFVLSPHSTCGPPAIGQAVSCCATSAAFGSYSVVASSALLPGAGHVHSLDGDHALVDPTRA